MVSIRNATIDDIQAILELEQGFGVDAWTHDQFASELTNPYAYYRVAHDGPSIIGYCGALLLCDQADIQTLLVKPQYRRMGVATALLHDVIDHLKDEKVSEVFLEVSATNSAAIKLYTKLNFKNIGIRRNYYKTGDDAVIMRKEMLP